jgi:hypothetical protein
LVDPIARPAAPTEVSNGGGLVGNKAVDLIWYWSTGLFCHTRAGKIGYVASWRAIAEVSSQPQAREGPDDVPAVPFANGPCFVTRTISMRYEN